MRPRTSAVSWGRTSCQELCWPAKVASVGMFRRVADQPLLHTNWRSLCVYDVDFRSWENVQQHNTEVNPCFPGVLPHPVLSCLVLHGRNYFSTIGVLKYRARVRRARLCGERTACFSTCAFHNRIGSRCRPDPINTMKPKLIFTRMLRPQEATSRS